MPILENMLHKCIKHLENIVSYCLIYFKENQVKGRRPLLEEEGSERLLKCIVQFSGCPFCAPRRCTEYSISRIELQFLEERHTRDLQGQENRGSKQRIL